MGPSNIAHAPTAYSAPSTQQGQYHQISQNKSGIDYPGMPYFAQQDGSTQHEQTAFQTEKGESTNEIHATLPNQQQTYMDISDNSFQRSLISGLDH